MADHHAIAEHRIRIPKTARFYTIGTVDDTVQDLWYVCHGYSELAGEFVTNFSGIAARGRLIVAPEALSRYYTNHAEREVGATWMTREDRLTDIEDYVEYLDLLHKQITSAVGAHPARIRLLGFSQGAATATRWAVRGSIARGELILWGGPIPPDLDVPRDLTRLRDWRLLMVFGKRDQYATDDAIATELRRMEDLNLQFDVIAFDGGHRLDDTTIKVLADTP